ncbi:MAG TPA: pitrilysin family protein [Gemmatimonadales bacterium]|nr:pitrilysin family protein [Gemmatimonadales bacterium]
MMRRVHHALAVACAAGALVASPLAGQAPAITHPPVLSPPAPLHVPAVHRGRLPNGIGLYVVEQHEVPLVELTLLVKGGGRSDGARGGLASFTAGMLDEGADTLDAFGIAAAADYLGADLATGADWDRSYVSLKVPRRNLAGALDLMAAVTLRPTFHSADVARQRALRLAGITQERDDPEVVAGETLASILYPRGHPYHRPLHGDSAAVSGFDSAAVRGFWREHYRPNRATMVVAGDITLAEATRMVGQAFGSWEAGGECAPNGRRGAAQKGSGAEPTVCLSGEPPVPSAPRHRSDPVRPPARLTIYLVDKPSAPQSVIAVGGAGVDRRNPDYYALRVMNTVLGGSFSSRLNQTLREVKGYSYGAGSSFEFRPLPGPFVAGTAVRTDVTDSSLVYLLKELRGIRESPVNPAELGRAKSYITLGLPGDFETTSELASRIAGLLLFGLPLDYYDHFAPRIDAVTAADVQRVARRYIQPDHLAVVIVGDVTRIRPRVEALGLGPVVVPAP